MLKRTAPEIQYCLAASFLANSTFLFSTQNVNLRIPLVDPHSHKMTDEYIYKYDNKMFSAYLKKRWINRAQIWPKMHIIDNMPERQMRHIITQKLFLLKKSLDDQTMKKVVAKDPTKINSAYIISVFSQQYFKQLLDEYVSKTLVCGKTPSAQSNQTMQEIEQKIIQWYRIFYFGERLTPLERQIQFNYLVAKQQKHFQKGHSPKNAFYRCIWRIQDQRLLQEMINWTNTDINLSDINNCPFYEPLSYSKRLPYAQKLHRIVNGEDWFSRYSFNSVLKKQYSYSYQYLSNISQKMYLRTLKYTKSLQFTNCLSIPPDFSVEIAVLNIHLWMIIDRLKEFPDSKQATNIIKMLHKIHKNHVSQTLGTLNLKKLAATQKKYEQNLQLAANTLDLHFNKYKQTKSDPYKFIDALIWSVGFRQKIGRYSDEIYKFSDYLIKNRENLRQYSLQDLIDGLCEFDPFLYDPDYRQKITQINPQLSKQEFQEQFNSNKQLKSYYYATHQPKQFTVDIKFTKKQIEDDEYSFFKALGQKTIRFMKKYLTNLDNYDHFSEQDEQKKKRQKESAKSPWKGEEQALKEIDEEFDTLNRIRKNKRNSSNMKEQ